MNDIPLDRMTAETPPSATFRRPATGLSPVGVLTPASGTGRAQTRIEQPQLLIGRGSKDDGVDLHIDDNLVSRLHARIRRHNSNYYLEDLNSANGTFLAGIPVMRALLHSGDTIQVGGSLFHFDRPLEFTSRNTEADSSFAIDELTGEQSLNFDRILTIKPTARVKADSTMQVRFWGTRGSIPTPGRETRKYGGNTTCLEVRYRDTIVVFDAGSGIREMSKAWSGEFGADPVNAHLLFTHLHWDHIQGFPFFGAAYQPQNSILVRGQKRKAGGIRELLGGQMEGDYFPVPLTAMQAQLEFADTAQEFDVGEIQVETFPLPHPGGCLGYRLTTPESVFVLATDCELDQVALNREQVAADRHITRLYDEKLSAFLSGADMLVIDCQYSDEEYTSKVGWGHNSMATVIDLCSQVQPGSVALTHHDPESSDETVASRVKDATERLIARGHADVLAFSAREHVAMAVAKPLKPAVVRQ